MRKRYYTLTGLIAIAIVFLVISIWIDNKKANLQENLPNEDFTSIDNDNISNEKHLLDSYKQPQWISKGLAIKTLVLTFSDKESVQVRDREIDFEDSSKSDWYDKYFNAAIVDGLYTASSSKLNPLDPLTYGEMKQIMDYYKVFNDVDGGVWNNQDSDPVQYTHWLQCYQAIVNTLAEDNRPVQKELYVFATPTVSTDLSQWEMATDKGLYSFEGITIDDLMNKRISVVVSGNEILYIEGVIEDTPVLTNAYIVEINKESKQATVFLGGASRKLALGNNINTELNKDFVADIQIVGDTLSKLDAKVETLHGVVKKISETEIEIEGIGTMPIAEDAQIYNVVGGVAYANVNKVLVGYDLGLVVYQNETIQAILIEKKPEIDNIRVVLNTTNYTGLIHSTVTATSTGTFNVVYNENKYTMEPSQVWDVSSLQMKIGERVLLIPEKEDGKIQITSIERGASSSRFYPSYRGTIEIERRQEGYLVVNEVDFEQYLYSVVPSEMPSSYGLEAAKVQAICARSYAYSQLLSNRFCQYGGHVDDSISCQVYNNIEETEQSIKAVNETEGLLLGYQGSVISANFFSTSCGVTSNSGDVWADYANKSFPTTSPEYLIYAFQGDKEVKLGDLSDEETFREFIMNDNIESFDSAFPWYRWKTTMTKQQLQESINRQIGVRYKAQPKLIKTLDSDDIFRSRNVESIGELVDVWVYSRGESGIITEIVIQGTNGIYKIATEYNIRALLAPMNYVGADVVITRKDGTTSKNMSLMPSAYFVMDKVYDSAGNLKEIKFYGGGYGHGVGMSQNGVKTMVEKGYTYAEILKHYYPGSEIMELD